MPEPDRLASALREAVLAFYAARGLAVSENTLETNSGYVERRGRPLLRMLGKDPSDPKALTGAELLDAGCGFGALSVFFAAYGARVTGIDPNEERFEVGRAVAARFGLDVTFVRAKMEVVPAPDRSFDLVVLNNSLCYVVDVAARATALAEARRVLRADGRLIARNPNRWNPLDQFTGLPLVGLLPPEAACWTAERLGRSRSRVRLLSPPAARRELREAGFADVRHHGFDATSRRPELLKFVARYQHLTARRGVDGG